MSGVSSTNTVIFFTALSLTKVYFVGSPYEMGLAQGQLMTQNVQGLIDDVWNYLEEQVVSPSNFSKRLTATMYRD